MITYNLLLYIHIDDSDTDDGTDEEDSFDTFDATTTQSLINPDTSTCTEESSTQITVDNRDNRPNTVSAASGSMNVPDANQSTQLCGMR